MKRLQDKNVIIELKYTLETTTSKIDSPGNRIYNVNGCLQKFWHNAKGKI